MAFQLIEELVCLKKAHILVMMVFKVTKGFPKEEIYGLTGQMRRAAVSIAANIAEGKARGSDKDFVRFLIISRASLSELRYLLVLSKDLQLLSLPQYNTAEAAAEEMSRVLAGTITFLKKSLKLRRLRSSEV